MLNSLENLKLGWYVRHKMYLLRQSLSVKGLVKLWAWIPPYMLVCTIAAYRELSNPSRINLALFLASSALLIFMVIYKDVKSGDHINWIRRGYR